jgi:6-phosphogluconolactonase
MNVEVLTDAEALAERSVEVLIRAAEVAIEERGLFVWAISGGTTPRRLLELLCDRRDFDWARTHLFQVDERLAPDGDPDRNATMLDEALLTTSFRSAHMPAGIWLMPVTADDPDAAAADYARSIDAIAGSPTIFDLIQLGMGSDGHTASLVPGDPILDVTDVDVALTDMYNGRRRMSLTWPVLDRAKELLWVIGGASKHAAVQQFLNNDPNIPATLPTQARATVLLDEAAAGDGVASEV